MTEPLLPQSETPMIPLDTVTRGFNPHAVPATQSTEPRLTQLKQQNPNNPQPETPFAPQNFPLTTPPDPLQTAIHQTPEAPKKRNRSSKKPNPGKNERKMK